MKHITDVRKEAIDILKQLRAGTIDPKVASEMLNAVGKITSMCKAQLTYHSLRREAPDMPFLASNGK